MPRMDVSPEEMAELEERFAQITDEEALSIRLDNERRLARARMNVGAMVGREGLGELAYEVVAKIAVEILEGTIVVRTPSQARDVASVFHNIARLEAGKPTQLVGSMTRDERQQRIIELAEESAKRLDAQAAAAEAVADGTHLRLAE